MKMTLPVLAMAILLALLLWALAGRHDKPAPVVPGANDAREVEAAPVLEGEAREAPEPLEPAVAERGPGRIEGHVFLQGKPAAAHVEVRELRYNGSNQNSLLHPPYSAGPLLGEAQTDAEGFFLIKALAEGSYELHALSETGHTAWQRAFLRPRNPHVKTRLNLIGGDANQLGCRLDGADRC